MYILIGKNLYNNEVKVFGIFDCDHIQKAKQAVKDNSPNYSLEIYETNINEFLKNDIERFDDINKSYNDYLNNKTEKFEYPFLIKKCINKETNEYSYYGYFIDIETCSCFDYNIDELIREAKISLCMHLETMKEYKLEIPKPTIIDDVKNMNYDCEKIVMIEITSDDEIFKKFIMRCKFIIWKC